MEGLAIHKYKEYHKKHFNKKIYEKISDYWTPSFNESRFFDSNQNDKNVILDSLTEYLNELEKYSKTLTRASELRNQHFIDFIKEEEDGHRHFRLSMLAAAKDTREILELWTKIRDDLFNDLINAQQVIQRKKITSSIRLIADIRDVDDYSDINIKFDSSLIAKRPSLSNAERKRRKRQR